MRTRLRARFRASIVAQVSLLVISIVLLSWTLVHTNHIAVPVVLLLAISLQIAGLLSSIQAHVATLEDFFAAVNYEDLTRRFVADDLDTELTDQFNRIIERFADARAERDVQANYLATVVHHVPVAFFAARADGSLALVNNGARRLTGLTQLTHLNDLAGLDPTLPDKLQHIEAGRQQLVQTHQRQVPVEWRISVSQIRIGSEVERLYSIENLSGELTARESSAWRNLLRVLTHEIMNTLTPVTSLATTSSEMLSKQNADPEIRDAVSTIARRSNGLMSFVSRYRELMRVPAPQVQELSVTSAAHAAATLMREQFSEIPIEVDVSPKSLKVSADQALLEQVLVNLLRNAAEALTNSTNPHITFSGRLDRDRVLMQVADNGAGIPDHVMEQIFVPFFTTKREGSGIGLSLSRQIMSAHGGEIAVQSDQRGTVVSLVFG